MLSVCKLRPVIRIVILYTDGYLTFVGDKIHSKYVEGEGGGGGGGWGGRAALVVGVSVTHAPRHLRMLRSAWHELNMNLITATCLAWRHAITLLVRATALAL
jgi:hypothetical protein